MEWFYLFMRRGCLWLGIFCLICGLLPVVTHGIWKSEGIWALLLASCYFLLVRQQPLWNRVFGKHWRWMEGTLYLLTAAGLVLVLLLSGMMVRYALFHRAPEGTQTTLVVLGCKISGDRPTIMLRQRLDSAYQALVENPELKCVVSGGQGADERYPESQVMQRYLVEKGIAPERIAQESVSSNTRENLLYSMEIIKARGWPETVTLVTNGYHQCRAALIAQKLGISCYNRYAPTSFYLAPAYVVREYLGILHLWLFA